VFDHYLGLTGAYAIAILGWWIAFSLLRRAEKAPTPWREPAPYELERPWRELGIALLGAIGVLLIGQLWSRGWMLPATGPLAPPIEAVNQILIFVPVLLVPVLRRQGLRTALLPTVGWATRLVVGVVLAGLALSVYALLREGSRGPLAMAGAILRFENLDEAVQVLAEDLAIGIVLFRLASAVRRRWAVAGVAALFAVGHVPALVADGVGIEGMANLVLDLGLGVMILGTVLRSADVLWFWPIHTVLDLTQFTRVSGL